MDVLTGIGYFIRSILALVAIILLANFALKKLQEFSTNQAKSIHILERVSVSKASALALVKIGKQIYLMSLTENSSEILKEFSEEEAQAIETKYIENKKNQNESSDLFETLKGFQDKYQQMFEDRNNQ